MRVSVKNMVCDRCISAVARICARLSIPVTAIGLGYIDTADEPDDAKTKQLRDALAAEGFELIDDPEARLVERARLEIIDMARGSSDSAVRLTDELPRRLGIAYRTLSRIFSAHEQRTLENYFIAQKIERVKELISYGDLSISEIAWQCGYSSVAHLSRQFKQVTGMTPTQFGAALQRNPLDKV